MATADDDRVVALGHGREMLACAPSMSAGTPFHDRTAGLNAKLAWGDWAGRFAAAVYADDHHIEYNAIRNAAGLIDVSPLYKYELAGPDALRLVDRVVTRDATKLAVGQVMYTPGATSGAR